MTKRNTLVLASVLISGTLTSHATLILNLTGIPGSNVISYSASGSYINAGPVGSVPSGAFRVPFAGAWQLTFTNNMGDMIVNSAGNLNSLALQGGGIDYYADSTFLRSLDTIDLEASLTPGGDSVIPNPTVIDFYPALSGGEILTWSGSGTFSLSGGFLFDTYFIPGTYSDPSNPGVYAVTITDASAPIPEPSNYLAFAGFIGLGGFLIWRRRKASQAA